MKISYRAAAVGAGAYTVLGNDSDRSAIIRDYNPTMQGTAQVDELFQAPISNVLARGNRAWSLSFAIERTHADLDTAAAFIVTHPAALPDQVDLKIEQGLTAVYLAAAAFTGFRATPEGLSTVCNYEFKGKLTSTAP